MLSEDHPVGTLSRYSFAYFKPEFEIFGQKNEATEGAKEFKFGGSHNENNDEDTAPRKYFRTPKPVQIEFLHKKICKGLLKYLQKEHKKENVVRENQVGSGANRIDVVLKQGTEYVFYEVKTYNSIKTSIREAMGQIIEYAFYPDVTFAKKLVIVTQHEADEETIKYFKHLRKVTGLQIYYQQYDLESKHLKIEY